MCWSTETECGRIDIARECFAVYNFFATELVFIYSSGEKLFNFFNHRECMYTRMYVCMYKILLISLLELAPVIYEYRNASETHSFSFISVGT